jgi:glycosyltransferase involved in cell wall biosynthesis
MTYLVAQLGARMHYAVPRILHEAGELERFFTDLSAVSGWPGWFCSLPVSQRMAGLRRISGRFPKDVPTRRITAFNMLGVRYAYRRRRARSRQDFARAFLWAGRTLCKKVISHGFGDARGVYVFNTAGLELLEAARDRGCSTVLEQTIAPLRTEHTLVERERERFPSWQNPVSLSGEFKALIEREEAEWKQADVILCGSPFVRDSVAACGGPSERCIVVPYGIDQRFHSLPRPRHPGPFRVLTVGAVGLRKGSPYVLAAAKALGKSATFRAVGAFECAPGAVEELGSSVELTGAVTHAEVRSHLAWADAFLLPSLCEGSATVIYEALSASLPVICTPNCGSIVRDGVDGFIVPPRDSEAIADAVLRLVQDPALCLEMANNARARAQAYDLPAYGRALLNALEFSNDRRSSRYSYRN